MLLANKQVFMYFLNAPINPSEFNQEQYQKVLEFRGKYKDKGIYAIVDDKFDFQRQFTNHLSLYFLSLIWDSGNSKSEILNPMLKIRDLNTFSEEYCSISMNKLLESKFINNQKDKIIESIETLNNFILPERSKDISSEKYNFNELTNITKSYGQISKLSGINNYVKISDE